MKSWKSFNIEKAWAPDALVEDKDHISLDIYMTAK